MGGRVHAERDGSIGRLVFDHPERRNAISAQMWQEIPGASGTSQNFTIVEFVTVYIMDTDITGGGANALTTVTVIPMKSRIYANGIEFADGAFSDSLINPFQTIKLVE